MNDKTRTLNQDDWKRTQVRMPQEQYQAVMDYAEKNNISLNTAMLELMGKALTIETTNQSEKSNAVAFNPQEIQKIFDNLITPQHQELLKQLKQIQNLLPKNN